MRKSLYTTVFLLLGLFSIGAGPKVPALPPLLDEKGLITLLANKEAKPLLLDVRTQEEFAEGYIPGALLLPYDEIATRFKEADKGRPIVVYCRSGRRSGIARTTLMGLGFTNVSDFGAFTKWRGTLATK
jgi:phage shock protein E